MVANATASTPVVHDFQSAHQTAILSAVHIPALVGDLIILVGGYNAIAIALNIDSNEPMRLIGWSVILLLLWIVFAFNYGAYERSVVHDRFLSAYVVIKVAILAGAVFHLLPFLGGPVNSRITSAVIVVWLAALLALWRLVLVRLVPPPLPIDLVVVGAGWAGQALQDALERNSLAGMRIAAFVDSDPAIVGKLVRDVQVYSVGRLGGLIQEATRQIKVVMAITAEADSAVYDELTSVAQSGVEIVPMASVYEQVSGRIPVQHLNNAWWAILPRPSTDVLYVTIKRVADIIFGLFGLALLGLILPVVALLFKLYSPGPLFFRQKRMGRHGKAFEIVKLRTLPSFQEEFSTFWERKNGNKPSAIGSFLRASGLDELPQCLNVLKGEMSIIGPRPYVPEEVEDLQMNIPFFRSRSLAAPGITGWAQVNFGYGLTLEDEIEKLQYDLYYLGHQSFYLDLRIFFRTLALIILRRRRGRRQGQGIESIAPG